ncbi:MAG: ribonuclease H-like domain-containing protein [Bacteroidota bacterium]|nr:ribonuclease H-like domain-containing protein [Bacteroidota bacterium]
MNNRIVLDIETAGMPFEAIEPAIQEYLLRYAQTEDEVAAEKQKTGLYPYTAEIVCIGMLNPDTNRGQVLVSAPPGSPPWCNEEGTIEFFPHTERSMLERFWEIVSRYDQIITFNGRGFDAPFLHIRSAILGVKCTRNLMPPRFDASQHIDMLEELTFHGASRKFSLDIVCIGFGIDSPKRHGVVGLEIAEMHRAGRYREIAEYNVLDLLATKELWERWVSTQPPKSGK